MGAVVLVAILYLAGFVALSLAGRFGSGDLHLCDSGLRQRYAGVDTTIPWDSVNGVRPLGRWMLLETTGPTHVERVAPRFFFFRRPSHLGGVLISVHEWKFARLDEIVKDLTLDPDRHATLRSDALVERLRRHL